jgi:hypothetical protein
MDMNDMEKIEESRARVNAQAAEMSERLAAFEARADKWEMSPARRDLEMRRVAWGDNNIPIRFLLTHGRDYAIGPETFSGPRGEVHGCFKNAAHLALANESLTYVEGTVYCYGIGIDHAWCATADGVVIDPTLEADKDGKLDRITAYFGVPFRRDYLRKALLWNKVYGLLDYFHAPATVPKLYELGLEAGQQWVLDQPARPPRKPRKKKAAK